MDMALTKSDRQDIEEMLDRAIETMNNLSNAKTTGIVNVIDVKLDTIIQQTTKTNGTVIAHSKQINDIQLQQAAFAEDVLYKYNHSIEKCPQADTIATLKDYMISQKGFWSKLSLIVGIIAAIAGIIFSVIL